jgi:ribonuclease HI
MICHTLRVAPALAAPNKHEERNVEKTRIYTDGGCSGNPGPGAWAAIIDGPGGENVIAGGEPETTNNRMELSGVIHALEEAFRTGLRECHFEVYTDSQYVKKGITEWIKTWIKNGWKNSAKDPVKNRDLWQRLLALSDAAGSVSWFWVKGHASHPQNNRCDALVQEEIRRLKKTMR